MLGHEVAIEGTRFDGLRRPPFVVATQVKLLDAEADAD